jgi:hypothetical protein
MKVGHLVFLGAALAPVACRPSGDGAFATEAGARERPEPDGSLVRADPPLLPTRGAPTVDVPALDVVLPDAATKRKPDPVGGSWVTCYGNYRPTSTPEQDVTRLGILCGPANGMRLVGNTLKGEASEAMSEHPFDARSGECFRIFAVAETSAPDIAVVVRDPKGSPIASDHNNDRWPIVNPDGPFCVLETGKYALQVHARQGKGKFALQIWRL